MESFGPHNGPYRTDANREGETPPSFMRDPALRPLNHRIAAISHFDYTFCTLESYILRVDYSVKGV